MATTQMNHYQALLLDPGVDQDILVTVYRRLIQRHGSPAPGDDAAVKRLQAIEQAYTVLRDPYRRARYDADLAAGRAGEAQTLVVDSSPGVVRDGTGRAVLPVAKHPASGARTVPVSVLDFGRYAGWSLRRLAAHDPNYLEWLLRAPGGRQYHAEITALLRPR